MSAIALTGRTSPISRSPYVKRGMMGRVGGEGWRVMEDGGAGLEDLWGRGWEVSGVRGIAK